MDHILEVFQLSNFLYILLQNLCLPLYRFIIILLLFSCQVVFDFFVTLWTATHQISLSHYLPQFVHCFIIFAKMSDHISLFIVITSDWPSWYHFEAVCTNVKDLKLWYQYLCVFSASCAWRTQRSFIWFNKSQSNELF